MHRLGGLSRSFPLILASFYLLSSLSPRMAAAYPRNWHQTIATEQHFDVDPGGTLVVQVPDANVTLQSGSPGKIDVEIEVA